MNKKGFTLIELVSVIIILGTILAIAIPNVLNIIDGSKERAFEASSNSIARKLESSSILKDYENKIINIVDGNFVEEDVKVTGDLPDSGTIFLNDRGQVAFTLFKENYCALKEFNGNVQVFEDINMCELVFSTITLIGDNPFYLRQNTIYEPTVYVEPGFIAVDEFGNLATDKVTVTSNIDINTVGTYTVNYVLKNYSGDTIDTDTRTVIVYDGIPPMVTTAVAISNNTTNNKYAINGNTVTLNLTFTKSVTDPTVTIGGRTATVTG
ncbi:MAG: DUF5011 domain-containing protein, partial [Bacilli bacterium]|nr:DUF5011 domain-containing protein [Bacilli bacterium]